MVLLEGAWILRHHDQAIKQDWELIDVETRSLISLHSSFNVCRRLFSIFRLAGISYSINDVNA